MVEYDSAMRITDLQLQNNMIAFHKQKVEEKLDTK